MKHKLFLCLNDLLLAALAACTWIYTNITGSLRMKGITAGCFVLLGLVNLVYALCSRPRRISFPLVMCAGLTMAMLGDLLLDRNFVLGAGLFALGHVLYTAAMYIRQRYAPLDLEMTGVMLLIALGILAFTPGLRLTDPALRTVCYVYALIISCMAGKAVSGFLRERTVVTGLLALGSVLFYFSDVMLLLAWFAGAGGWADTACLWTYFPGQGVLAHAGYWYVRRTDAARGTATPSPTRTC